MAKLQTECGTPLYIAPEVLSETAASHDQGYDEKCDVWSCGIIIYMLLSGLCPFGGESVVDVLREVAGAALVFHSPEFDNVSKSAQALLRAMIERNVTRRLSAAAALEHAWFAEELRPECFSPNVEIGRRLSSLNPKERWKKVVNVITVMRYMQDLATPRGGPDETDESRDRVESQRGVALGVHATPRHAPPAIAAIAEGDAPPGALPTIAGTPNIAARSLGEPAAGLPTIAGTPDIPTRALVPELSANARRAAEPDSPTSPELALDKLAPAMRPVPFSSPKPELPTLHLPLSASDGPTGRAGGGSADGL